MRQSKTTQIDKNIESVEELGEYLKSQLSKSDGNLWYMINRAYEVIHSSNTEVTGFSFHKTYDPEYGDVIECTIEWNYYHPTNFCQNQPGITDTYIVEIL